VNEIFHLLATADTGDVDDVFSGALRKVFNYIYPFQFFHPLATHRMTLFLLFYFCMFGKKENGILMHFHSLTHTDGYYLNCNLFK
jgi:hypothetical protein